MTKIALDIDDVLAGFAFQVHKVLGNEKLLVPHDHWNQTGLTGKLMVIPDEHGNFKAYTEKFLDKCEHNRDFWANLPVLSLPCDIDFDVACYITSSPENMLGMRRVWLKKNGFPLAPVIHSKEKHVTMKRLGVEVLVDDKLSTVKAVANVEGLRAFHFKPWYCNVESEYTIENLKELKERL